MSNFSYWDKQVPFATLLGKTLTAVTGEVGGDEIRFTTDDGKVYMLYHRQDCCESVDVDDIVGDLSDLIGSPILIAEEAESEERPADVPKPEYEYGTDTWTFYKLATVKGYVDIRWHGSSNGYYSESVDFVEAE
jgi:hypothetical protein